MFTRCQAEGVAAAPVLHELELMQDPHARARNMFRPNGNDSLGTHLYPGHVFRWTGPDLAWNPLPELGVHNDAVYRDLLGLSDEEYDALAADGHLSRDYLGVDGEPL